jgi:hypothetical protein
MRGLRLMMSLPAMLMFGAAMSFGARAMTFDAAPPVLYMGGPVVATDWAAFEEALSRHHIDTIVLHQSSGGDSNTGRRIGAEIRKRGLNTVVLGRCMSACANMFLAGVTRQYAAPQRGVETLLGYHGSYSKESKAVNRRRTADYFVRMSDGKMDAAFVERFIRLENKQGMMRFKHRDQRVRPNDPLVLLCKGDEVASKRNEQCETLSDADALSKGVVTTWEVRDVAPPDKPSLERITIRRWEAQQAPASSTFPGGVEYAGG